jgi:hypothetical protein
MVFKKVMAGFCITIAIIAGLLFMAGQMTHAQNEGASDPTVLAKLNEILGNQKEIMADLANMKEQLRILTVRVTQAQ